MKISTYTGGFVATNSYLIEHEDTAIVFDAAMGTAAWLEQQDVEVSHLLLTHQHWDHVDDVAKLQEKGVKVLSHSDHSEDLIMAKRARETWGLPVNIEEYKADQIVAADEILEIGSLKIKALYVPGHSPDSLAYFIEGHDTVIAGDALFRLGVGRTDFPNGDHDQLMTSIKEQLYTLADETIVYPGHGPETTIGYEKEHNDFV